MSRYYKYIYYLMVFIPVIAMLIEQGESSRSIGWYMRIMYTFMALLMFMEAAITRKKLCIPKGTGLLLLYAIYIFLWGMVNGSLDRRGLILSVVNNAHLQTVFMLIVSYNVLISDKQHHRLVRIMVFTVYVAALVSIYQIFEPSFLDFTSAREIGGSIYTIRRGSIFSNVAPLELGLSFLPILALVTVDLLLKKSNSVIQILLMGGIVAILSNTRWVMVGYLIVLSMVGFQYRSKILGRVKTISLTMVVVILLGYVIGLLGYDFTQFWNERLLAEGSLDRTTRYLAFENFLIFFPRTPWFGTGVHLTDEIWAASRAVGSSQIHVGYLSHLVSYGLIGSVLFFGFLFRVCQMLYINAKKTGYWGSFYGFLVFIWGNATFVHFGMFYYGMILLFAFDKYYLDKHKRLKSVHVL